MCVDVAERFDSYAMATVLRRILDDEWIIPTRNSAPIVGRSTMGMTGAFTAATDERISAFLEDPEQVRDFLFGDEEKRELDIEKSWHAIHFLLNGDAQHGKPPLDFICAGGSEVGDEDVRAFTSAQVREIEAALRPQSHRDLMAHWDGERIRRERIYKVNPDDPEGEVDYAVWYLEKLKEFLADLARDKLGMLFYIG
jgi:hypothetical protein